MTKLLKVAARGHLTERVKDRTTINDRLRAHIQIWDRVDSPAKQKVWLLMVTGR